MMMSAKPDFQEVEAVFIEAARRAPHLVEALKAHPMPAKFAAIYEVSGNVVCYATLDSGGADVTATNGNTLTVGGTSATVFTLA
jgi:hypothetical protein